MAMLRKLISVAAAMVLLMELAMAANYTVGAPNGGWDLMTPLQAWANSQNFSVGDSLTFVYAPNHDVLEVSKPDYDACLTNNSVASFSGGMTVITLTSSGNRYFVCGSQGHCDRGMKMVVTTLGASAPPPAVPPPAGTPSAPAPATPSAPSPATPASPTASPPVSAPVPSPPSKTRAPVHAPKMAPKASPTMSPANSPASTPALSESPATPPFPDVSSPSTTPSSASKINVFAAFTIGFGSVIMMLLTL